MNLGFCSGDYVRCRPSFDYKPGAEAILICPMRADESDRRNMIWWASNCDFWLARDTAFPVIMVSCGPDEKTGWQLSKQRTVWRGNDIWEWDETAEKWVNRNVTKPPRKET